MTWLLIILVIIVLIVGVLYEIFSFVGFVLENIFSGIGFVLGKIFSGIGQILPKMITGLGLALDTIFSGIGQFFEMVFSSTLGKVISLITILSIIVIVIVGCLIYEAQRPMSEKMADKIEQYENSLSDTKNLLNKREMECDVAQREFFNKCTFYNQNVDVVASELQKSDSEHKTEPWFRQVRFCWSEWKDIERDVAILSRQKERLKMKLEDMNFLLRKLKRIEETKPYITDDDPILNDIIARAEAEVNKNIDSDAPYKSLSSAEKTEIDITVSHKMQEAIKSSSVYTEK